MRRVDLGETKLQGWQQGGSLVLEAVAQYFKQQNTKSDGYSGGGGVPGLKALRWHSREERQG